VLSSKVSEEDASTNRFSCVKRLKEFNQFAVADEDRLLVYDLRNTRTPMHSIDHYLNETVEFNDIVPVAFSQAVPSLSSFEDLESLKPWHGSSDAYLLMSTKNPSQLLHASLFKERAKRDIVISDLGRLSRLDGNLVLRGLKPSLVQSSPMYNTVSKLRGCQLLPLKGGAVVFTCDTLGGLYVSGLNHNTNLIG